MRTFISIEIPEEIKNNIENVVNDLKLALTPIKWVDKKNLHMTLKFLGWVEDRKIDGLINSVTGLVGGSGSVKLGFQGLGVFPDEKRPRVIWVGLSEGEERLRELADKIEDELAKQGYREEERGFSAHLTIGRVKEKINVEALSSLIKENEKRKFGEFVAKHVSLMKSTLMRSGPVYEEVKQINLTP